MAKKWYKEINDLNQKLNFEEKFKKKKGSKKGQKKGFQHTFTRKENGNIVHAIEMSEEDAKEHTLMPVKENHLKQGKMYNDFCILNQEFLKYIMFCALTKNEYRILMFLLAYMDMNNKIIIDAEMIEYHLKIGKTNINKYITSLQEKKIIYKRNLGYTKGVECVINFDIISPHLAFKNKNNRDNVANHKKAMEKDLPYMKQHNLITGGVDYVSPDGEIFHQD